MQARASFINVNVQVTAPQPQGALTSYLCPIFRDRRYEGVDPGTVTIQQRLEASFGEKAAEAAAGAEAALVSSWGPVVGVARSGAEQPGQQESSYG